MKSWLNPAMNTFLVLSFIGAAIFSFNGSQLASINGTSYSRAIEADKIMLRIPRFLTGYYGHDLPPLANHKNLDTINFDTKNEFYIFTFIKLKEQEKKLLTNNHISCEIKKTFHPSPAEQLVIKLNPKFNMRRMKTVIYYCTKDN